MFACLILALAISTASSVAVRESSSTSMLRTDLRQLSSSKGSPIERVVTLLKDMQDTIQKEMEEDEKLYKELACWCNSGSYEKNSQIDESTAKISELEASIESLSAKQAALTTKIKELEASVASNKNELAEAKALRAKQLKEFHGNEMDSIQAIENIKAALVVLGKHDVQEKSTNWHENLLQRSSAVSLASVRAHGKKKQGFSLGPGPRGPCGGPIRRVHATSWDFRGRCPSAHGAFLAGWGAENEWILDLGCSGRAEGLRLGPILRAGTSWQ
eukprot:gnl/TRDRNA2_/TRDRNA2_176204_c8_seq46.p1 gnl/TRDRNA2_/TRDRNA2_176204_c8~~gnl/TRDRNA2_/TRDRNA2_176204_c8_seq46.p1  ORF type:complete len:273 (+),score=71.55 gnl/TRDRNA2_/TRDRNA2_176204_c8_seq46:85-903(+)